jgi:hypothetical protein
MSEVTLNATALNELAQTVQVQSELVLSAAPQIGWVQIAMVQIVVPLNDWVLNVATRTVRIFPAAHSFRVVTDAQEVHCAVHFSKAHFSKVHFEVIHFAEVAHFVEVIHFVEVAHFVEVVRSFEVELRCAGVVLHCVAAFQRVVVVHFAGVSQRLGLAPLCFARVAPVQFVRDFAWTYHQSLRFPVTPRVLVATRRLQRLTTGLPFYAQGDHRRPFPVALALLDCSRSRAVLELVASRHQLDASPLYYCRLNQHREPLAWLPGR